MRNAVWGSSSRCTGNGAVLTAGPGTITGLLADWRLGANMLVFAAMTATTAAATWRSCWVLVAGASADLPGPAFSRWQRPDRPRLMLRKRPRLFAHFAPSRPQA